MLEDFGETLDRISHKLIKPKMSMQNGFIESLNGKFKDECLSKQWFQYLSQARDCITEWCTDFYEVISFINVWRIPPTQFP